jgi:hypothetical protein
MQDHQLILFLILFVLLPLASWVMRTLRARAALGGQAEAREPDAAHEPEAIDAPVWPGFFAQPEPQPEPRPEPLPRASVAPVAPLPPVRERVERERLPSPARTHGMGRPFALGTRAELRRAIVLAAILGPPAGLSKGK